MISEARIRRGIPQPVGYIARSESQKTFSEMSEKWDWKGPWKSLTLTLTNEGTEALKSEGTCPSWDAAEPRIVVFIPTLGPWLFPLHQKEGRGSDGTEDGFKRGQSKSRDQ